MTVRFDDSNPAYPNHLWDTKDKCWIRKDAISFNKRAAEAAAVVNLTKASDLKPEPIS
jgi:hypothetical protein